MAISDLCGPDQSESTNQEANLPMKAGLTLNPANAKVKPRGSQVNLYTLYTTLLLVVSKIVNDIHILCVHAQWPVDTTHHYKLKIHNTMIK